MLRCRNPSNFMSVLLGTIKNPSIKGCRRRKRRGILYSRRVSGKIRFPERKKGRYTHVARRPYRYVEQEGGPGDRGAGGGPGVLGDAGQERADRGIDEPYRGIESVVVLPGKDDTPDDAAHRCRRVGNGCGT